MAPGWETRTDMASDKECSSGERKAKRNHEEEKTK